MKRYLLDTNICVRFMRQKFGVDEHIEKVGWEHCTFGGYGSRVVVRCRAK